MIRKLFAAVAMTALMAGASLAADVKPAVVYDLGGKNDKSFNESAYMGAEKFRPTPVSPIRISRSRTTASASRHCSFRIPISRIDWC